MNQTYQDLVFDLVLGGIMIGVTVICHAIALDIILNHGKQAERLVCRAAGPFWKPILAGVIVVTTFVVHIIEIWLWAGLYISSGAFTLEAMPDALYFSTMTYTSQSFGDVMVEPRFRMLAATESANAWLLFGWTTAFIFEVISQIYRKESRNL